MVTAGQIFSVKGLYCTTFVKIHRKMLRTRKGITSTNGLFNSCQENTNDLLIAARSIYFVDANV